MDGAKNAVCNWARKGTALLLAPMLPAVAWAQDRPSPALAFPIESITVTGNQNYSREQIFAVTGLKVGQAAGPKDFEAARDRLAATGAFEKIEFRYGSSADKKGYAVSFNVVEAGPLFPVRFEDLGASDADLKAHLRALDPLFGERIPATESVLARYARALQEYLRSKEPVVGKVTAEETGQLAVVFRPAVTPPAVAEVRFSGNKVISSATLERAMGVAIGSAYTEKRFRQLLEANVRPLYEARGRVRVAFPQIRTEPARDVKGVVAVVDVDEGARYDLGKVHVEGGPVAAAELLKEAALKSEELFNAGQVRAAVERIERRLRREGYMRVKSAVNRQINDESKTVDLAIRLEPGPQYAFGALRITGLDIHGEAAIRRLWTLKEGRPFNADYPDYFLNRVREEGIFENLGKARAEIKPDDASLTVEVTLHFAGEQQAPKRGVPRP